MLWALTEVSERIILSALSRSSIDTEISLEFDPSDLDAQSLKAFAGFGVTRASLGVQDFDPLVQKTINRIQSFEQTKFVIDTLRSYGVTSLNIDALYGLPHQTLESLQKTLDCIDQLAPDRIALFGYAHVPWMKPHQKLIPEESLPDINMRFRQARLAEQYFKGKGYQQIGIDHFAKPTDSLAQAYEAHEVHEVHRNFQGYTADACHTLLGFGVSSISQFRGGYSQNVKDTHSYKRSLEAGELPTQRGIKRQGFDEITASAIDELMCYFTLSEKRLREKFGPKADLVLMRAERLAAEDEDGLFIKNKDQYLITEKGKPFARTIVSAFDEYLKTNETRYSVAV